MLCGMYFLLQSFRSCVSEIIQAIDNQLSKQEDIQKKKVWKLCYTIQL